MRSTVSSIFLTAVLITPSAPSAAEDIPRSFLGIMGGQMQLQLSERGRDLALDFPTVTARVGQDFLPWLGAEIRGGTTGEDEIVSGVDFSIPYFVSALARVGLLPGEGNSFGIYGLGGYTVAEFELDGFGETLNDSADGPSYGVGAEFMIDARNGFDFEYLRYLDKDVDGVDTELDHIGLGYLRRF